MKRINYRHFICLGITVLSVLLAVFCFPYAFGRLIESFKDFGISCVYYFQELFLDGATVNATVTEMSKYPLKLPFNLPNNWEEFKLFWSKYWQVFISKEIFLAYLEQTGLFIVNFCKILLLIMPVVLVIYLLFNRILSTQNNDYNEDTKQLKRFKKLVSVTYVPVKKWIKNFISFVKKKSYYYKLWALIWAYAFSFITIIIEALAFYLYFVVSFDLAAVYTQIVKLLFDLSAMFSFIPVIGWVIIIFAFVNVIRKKIGYSLLEHNENKNRGFINARPIVTMVCGTMGKKKTTLITDMALSEDVMLRGKAFELILENDLKFPFFPWINLENAIKKAMARHFVYNLATCKKFVAYVKYFYDRPLPDKPSRKSVLRHLKKLFGLYYENLLFDYDYKKYGLDYDNKLELVNIWKVINNYTQLYFIYVVQSSLILGNYSVRTDGIISDLGNFPLWDNDFFHRDSRYIDCISRHAKILDFDALRLGRKIIEDNPNKDSFEFGVVLVTEIGKERGNNLENIEKKKQSEETNQKNDLFNQWLKMVRHSATVDNFPFVKVITDEQRPASWGADARDLCEIVHIQNSGESRLLMPFFALEELLHDFIFSKFTDLYYRYRFNRSDNTLSMYLLKMFTSKIHSYYNGIYNTFGCCPVTVALESGTQDGQLELNTYYLSSKKIYSKRFATDSFGDYFTEKCARSFVGIADLREYVSERATFEELKQQNSYWINDIQKWR